MCSQCLIYAMKHFPIVPTLHMTCSKQGQWNEQRKSGKAVSAIQICYRTSRGRRLSVV
jgi:hypothetical protein